MDLSNYLTVRLRERQLLVNRVHAPFKVLKSGKNSYFSEEYVKKSLKACDDELEKYLSLLVRQVKIVNVET